MTCIGGVVTTMTVFQNILSVVFVPCVIVTAVLSPIRLFLNSTSSNSFLRTVDPTFWIRLQSMSVLRKMHSNQGGSSHSSASEKKSRLESFCGSERERVHKFCWKKGRWNSFLSRRSAIEDICDLTRHFHCILGGLVHGIIRAYQVAR